MNSFLVLIFGVVLMKFKLPYPHKDLMPNRKNGKHWSSTKEVKRLSINSAFYSTLENKPTIPLTKEGKYKLLLTYFQTDKRHRDLDNLLAASKAQIDGISKALGIDDKQFSPITIDRGFADESYMLVEIF